MFLTLQGEGVRAGRRAVFLRFAGCNLWTGREEDRANAVCRFCDTDFVGTDVGDRRSFVGAVQSRMRRAQQFPPLQPKPEPDANQPARQTEGASSVYPPRRALAPDMPELATTAVQSSLARHLERSQRIQWTGPWEVSSSGRTAVLQADVASEQDRAFAEALGQF